MVMAVVDACVLALFFGFWIWLDWTDLEAMTVAVAFVVGYTVAEHRYRRVRP